MDFDRTNDKPHYIKKYQRIFNKILKENSFLGDNAKERFKTQTKNNNFYDRDNKKDNKILYSNTLTIETDRSNLSNTKYNLLTGSNFSILNNITINSVKKNNYIPKYQPKNIVKNENTIRNFKNFIKNTEKKYSSNQSHNLNNHFPNHKRSRNLSGNIFVERLYSALPEYTNLTNRGQSFLNNNNNNVKEHFNSLKNRLNNM